MSAVHLRSSALACRGRQPQSPAFGGETSSLQAASNIIVASSELDADREKTLCFVIVLGQANSQINI